METVKSELQSIFVSLTFCGVNKSFFLILLVFPLTEAQPIRSRCGPEPVEVFWDAGNREDPPSWISRPQNLQGFLQQVGKTKQTIITGIVPEFGLFSVSQGRVFGFLQIQDHPEG